MAAENVNLVTRAFNFNLTGLYSVHRTLGGTQVEIREQGLGTHGLKFVTTTLNIIVINSMHRG